MKNSLLVLKSARCGFWAAFCLAVLSIPPRVALASGDAPSVESAGPLKNGGFESKADWQLQGAVVSPGQPLSGEACLEMSSGAAKGSTASQFVNLEPGTWYVCDFYYRITGASGLFQMRFMSGNGGGGQGIPAQIYYWDAWQQDSWTKGTQHVYSGPGGPCELEIRMFPLSGKSADGPQEATLFLDDIALRPMSKQDISAELLENGGFEDGRVGSPPPGWVVPQGSPSGSLTMQLTCSQFHTGNKALEVQLAGTNSTRAVPLAATAGLRRLAVGRNYVFTIRGKASRPIKTSFSVWGPVRARRDVELTTDWQEFRMDLNVSPEEQASNPNYPSFQVRIMAEPGTESATLWFDDASLRQARP
jgi:hypothetical protein